MDCFRVTAHHVCVFPFKNGLSNAHIICISVLCQPPQNYNFYASVDKYYKPVKQGVDWYQARDACINEGTILVELRTPQEYQAIRTIFGKIRLQCILLSFEHSFF